MIRTPPESSDAEIEAFAALIDTLSGFGAEVTPEAADGFMTAAVACRRPLMPSEWLPVLAGDAFERAFADPDAAATALATLLARWNVLAGQLHPEALTEWPDDLRLSPLIYQYSDEDRAQVAASGEVDEQEVQTLLQTGATWASGFLMAVEAFADDWPEPDVDSPSPDDQVYAQCLAQITLLCLSPDEFAREARPLYPDELPSREQLIDDACFAVQDLRLHGIDHAPRPATVRAEPRPGRNDPCPCGSGKKFKKCHGA